MYATRHAPSTGTGALVGRRVGAYTMAGAGDFAGASLDGAAGGGPWYLPLVLHPEHRRERLKKGDMTTVRGKCELQSQVLAGRW